MNDEITNTLTRSVDSISAGLATTSMCDLFPRTDENWIQTYTGKMFWPHNARVEDVDLIDIAHALSLKCRFTGHCITFYSVAEHSVLVSRLVPPEMAFAALMHDATEAYLPDVARPMKPLLPGFKYIEECLWRVIAKAFQINPVLPPEVKQADLIALKKERILLMGKPPRAWRTDEMCEDAHPGLMPRGEHHGVAKMMFLKRFRELYTPESKS